MTGEGAAGAAVRTPLYQLKAEFFRTLGHPARIRVLELLSVRERSAGELAREIGIEAAHLSQQMAVLRRTNLVASRKEGTSVHYRLTDPQVGELLRVARSILTEVLVGQADLLQDFRTASAGEEDR
ncbi:metalloregulator ArsR/SmtB family transcription factor [Actinocorallia aurea]